VPLEIKGINILGLKIGDDSSDGILGGNGAVLVFMVLGFTILNYAYNGIFRPLFTHKVDFEAYHNAALIFRYGGGLYDLMITYFREGPARYNGPFPYVYPPAFVIFLSPLGYLSFKNAVLMWFLINQLFFFSGVLLLLKSISRKYSWMEFIAMFFLCMNFMPLFIDYLVGQCDVLLFFSIVLALYFYRSGKDVYAGVSLSIACIIKVIPFFLLGYFLWKRSYKVFLACISAVLFIFLYSLLFFDIDLYVWYFKFMTHQTLFDAFHDNHSLTGFFTRMLVDTIWTKGFINSPLSAKICIGLSSALVLIVFLYHTRKRVNRMDERVLYEYGLAVISMLLLSKMTSTPYLVMLLVPMAIWVHGLFHHGVKPGWMILTGIAYGAISVWYPLPVGKFLNMKAYEFFLKGLWVNLFSIRFFALFVLWCYFLRMIIPSESLEKGKPRVRNGKE
jgi:hypothetical protein